MDQSRKEIGNLRSWCDKSRSVLNVDYMFWYTLTWAQYAASLASLKDKKYEYPWRRIDECWEKILLNQFHDVLPGSAIAMAYVDAEALYAEVREAAEAMLEEATLILLPQSTVWDKCSPITCVKDIFTYVPDSCWTEWPSKIQEIPISDVSALFHASKNEIQRSIDGTVGYFHGFDGSMNWSNGQPYTHATGKASYGFKIYFADCLQLPVPMTSNVCFRMTESSLLLKLVE